jgi:histidinol-phosphate aminotransferase
VADSDANFVLFGEFTDRRAVWQALLDRGVLIRETGPAAWLRVSVGTPAEMAAFKEALDEALDETQGAGPGWAQRPAGALGSTAKALGSTGKGASR